MVIEVAGLEITMERPSGSPKHTEEVLAELAAALARVAKRYQLSVTDARVAVGQLRRAVRAAG